MNIGESIYRLRTGKGMSQGDLADALGVSRQSVSKWETGSSVPDLDKLVKMSALFGVTLDELVKGETLAAEPSPEPEPRVIYVERAEPAYPRRKIVGLVLYGFALLVVLLCSILGGMLEGLLLSLPLWACGVICFVFKQRIGIWCSWALFFLVDVYLRYASGVTWGSIFTVVRGIFRNAVAGVVSAVLTLLLVVLMVVTVRSYREKVLALTRKVKLKLACCGTALAVLYLPWSPSAIIYHYAVNGEILHAAVRVAQVLSIVLQWGKVILFCILLMDLLAIRRWKKARNAVD